jgi:hypothetical protein
VSTSVTSSYKTPTGLYYGGPFAVPAAVEEHAFDTAGDSDLVFGDFDFNQWAAQSFQLSSAATISSVSLYLQNVHASVDLGVSVEIQADSGGNPDGTALAVSFEHDIVASAGRAWHSFSFIGGGPSLSASTTYWIVVKPDFSFDDQIGWYRDEAGGYGSGTLKTYDPTTWTDTGDDAYFRLYSATGTTAYYVVLYGAGNGWRLHVLKASDPTGTWTNQDGNLGPHTGAGSGDSSGGSFWAAVDGTDIVVAHTGSAGTDDIEFSVFSTSSDTWTTTEDTVQTITSTGDNAAYGVCIVVRDSDYVIMYNGEADADMGTDRSRVDVAYGTAGSWSSPVELSFDDDNSWDHIDYHVGSATAVEYSAGSFRVHCTFGDGGDAYQRAFKNDDTVQAKPSGGYIDLQIPVTNLSTGGELYYGGHGVWWDDSGTDRVRMPLPFDNQMGGRLDFDSGDAVEGDTDITHNQVGDSDDNNWVKPRGTKFVHDIVLDGTDVYTWLIEGDADEIVYDLNDGDDVLFSSGSITAIDMTVGIVPGDKIMVVWEDSTNAVWYDELDIAAAVESRPRPTVINQARHRASFW